MVFYRIIQKCDDGIVINIVNNVEYLANSVAQPKKKNLTSYECLFDLWQFTNNEWEVQVV